MQLKSLLEKKLNTRVSLTNAKCVQIHCNKYRNKYSSTLWLWETQLKYRMSDGPSATTNIRHVVETHTTVPKQRRREAHLESKSERASSPQDLHDLPNAFSHLEPPRSSIAPPSPLGLRVSVKVSCDNGWLVGPGGYFTAQGAHQGGRARMLVVLTMLTGPSLDRA